MTSLLVIAGRNQLGCRSLIGAVVPLLHVHFETTRSVSGFVLTGLWTIYGLAQFPSGMLADRYGEWIVETVLHENEVENGDHIDGVVFVCVPRRGWTIWRRSEPRQ